MFTASHQTGTAVTITRGPGAAMRKFNRLQKTTKESEK